jgi:predicted transposase/invertase (TIGR01784 family)
MIASTDENIKKAYDQLEILSQDKDAMLQYEHRMMEIYEHNTHMYVAREEGKESEKLETVKRLLKTGVGLEMIAIASGLTSKEAQSIIDSIQQN